MNACSTWFAVLADVLFYKEHIGGMWVRAFSCIEIYCSLFYMVLTMIDLDLAKTVGLENGRPEYSVIYVHCEGETLVYIIYSPLSYNPSSFHQ